MHVLHFLRWLALFASPPSPPVSEGEQPYSPSSPMPSSPTPPPPLPRRDQHERPIARVLPRQLQLPPISPPPWESRAYNDHENIMWAGAANHPARRSCYHAGRVGHYSCSLGRPCLRHMVHHLRSTQRLILPSLTVRRSLPLLESVSPSPPLQHRNPSPPPPPSPEPLQIQYVPDGEAGPTYALQVGPFLRLQPLQHCLVLANQLREALISGEEELMLDEQRDGYNFCRTVSPSSPSPSPPPPRRRRRKLL
jgi:hypothetical protein